MKKTANNRAVENEADALLKRLFPICRSISGNGVRETLRELQKYAPVRMCEVPTGTKVFDWTIPREWNISDAYIKDPSGKKIVDFKENNLHVVGYSTPVHTKVKLAELKKRLYSIPEKPSLIPYRTSYYNPDWGFCISHEQLLALKEGTYEAVIDSTLTDGSLTYGELLISGKTKDEVLISTYICHPSMANDNLSGPVLATLLARELAKEKKLRYSYRFLFVPETIGAIVWLSKNRARVHRIRHGLVATCVGDDGAFTYKKTRDGNAEIDRIVAHVLAHASRPHRIVDFFPSGSDERQYSSPGFNLPIGSLMRSMYDTFPEYHTSADNLDFVNGRNIAETLELYRRVIFVLERNERYKNTNPYGEPQLSKRGLYSLLGAQSPDVSERALQWVLNFSDGRHSLLDIAERSGIDFETIHTTSRALRAHKLLAPVQKKGAR
ncbi:DUF4910 domain-containing protein [Candidatus Kaiserbacteria bacterium]|nr:DUF4910 domain-containing protein [Candidatus Kaiserbacteria bacterium]